MLLWGKHESRWTLGKAENLPDRPTLLDALRRKTRSSGDAVVWERWIYRATIDLSEREGRVVAACRIETSNWIAVIAVLVAACAFASLCERCAFSPFAQLALLSLSLAPAALLYAIASTWLLVRRVRRASVPRARVVR